MAVIKNTPRYLKIDDDNKIIQPSEMPDALNIRVTEDVDGNSGVIKNIPSNAAASLNLGYGLGTNKVVGTYEHEGTNRLFVFIYNSLGVNTVYEMNQGDSGFTKIIESSNILLSGEHLHIDGVVISDELFLYFTDGVNEPQRVNVDTSIGVGDYPDSQGQATVIKASPLAPSVSFETDSNKKTDNLFGKSFQFALQYVYVDGEVSAIGEYSENFCAPNTLAASVNTTAEYEQDFNKITITHNSILGYSSDIVSNVRVYFRDVLDNTMFNAGEYGYNEISQGIDFYNDGVYPAVSDSEYNKLQDSVPRRAKAQTVTANRLFYGNYTEGFDKATVSATLSVNYNDESVGTSLPMSRDTGTSSIVNLDTTGASSLIGTGDDVELIVDYTLADNSLGYYKVRTQPIIVTVYDPSGAVAGTSSNQNQSFRVPRGTNISANASVSNPSNASDFNTKLASELSGMRFTISIPNSDINYAGDWAFRWEGFAVIELTATATATGVEIENDVIAYNLNAKEILEKTGQGAGPSTYTIVVDYSASIDDSNTTTSVTGFDISDSNTIAYTNDLITKTFKASESHAIGVVFEDDYGRTTGVYELGSIEVEELAARASGSRGSATIDATLSVSGLDSSLTKYFYVHNDGSSIEKFLQFGVTEAVTAISDEVKKQFSEDAIFVSLRSIQGKGQSFNSRGGDLDVGFAKGDKLRILSYGETSKTYPKGFVFDVTGVYVSDSASNLDSDTDFQGTGTFLVLENANYEGFGVTYVGTNNSLWEQNTLVEVFTPKKEDQTRIYKAISQKYNTQPPISNIGQVQNLNEGNAWYKRRLIQYKGGGDRLVNEYAFVESQQYNDLSSLSKGTLGGKPYAVIKNEKENHRISSITYSDAQLVDSGQNNLSSFNSSLANFFDYEMNYGGIYGLIDSSDSIMLLQSDKVSRVPVSRQILSTATGNSFVTQSTDVLGLQQHYQGNFGINEDRSAFLKADGDVYLVDATRSKLIAITPQGVSEISEEGVSSWVEGRCNSMLEDPQGYFISIGNDKDNKEVIFSLQNKPISNTKSIIFSKKLGKFTSFVSYTGSYYGNLGNRFFQIRDNNAYEAEKGTTYGNFFGTQSDASFTTVFNSSPSTTKVFQALSMESNRPADITIETAKNSATINKNTFSEREDAWYGYIPRSEGSSEYMILGVVAAEDDPKITFSSRVSRIPFRLGGDAYVYSNGAYIPLNANVDGIIDSNSLSFTNAGAISIGDVIAIKSDSSIDGDAVRGHYAKVQYVLDDSSKFEVFAVNASVAQSSLNNNGGSQQ